MISCNVLEARIWVGLEKVSLKALEDQLGFLQCIMGGTRLSWIWMLDMTSCFVQDIMWEVVHGFFSNLFHPLWIILVIVLSIIILAWLIQLQMSHFNSYYNLQIYM